MSNLTLTLLILIPVLGSSTFALLLARATHRSNAQGLIVELRYWREQKREADCRDQVALCERRIAECESFLREMGELDPPTRASEKDLTPVPAAPEFS